MRVRPNQITKRYAKPVRLKSNRRSGGYTLLELLLSLALSVLVIGIIGSAIQLYLISLNQVQSKIERKQIARGLIQMISNDIRASVQYKAADYADLENLVQTQLLAFNEVAADLEALESGDLPSETDETDETEFTPVIDEAVATFRPSLVGNANSIAIDISRLPRLDQYNSIIAGDTSETQTPSDIKTLGYFFSGADPSDNDGVQFSSIASGGLYRRQIDRAVASHAGDSGLVTTPDEYSQLVSSEVAEVRFRYFNGQSWQSAWDSEESAGFPPAIEVILVIDPSRSTSGQAYLYRGFDSEAMEQYRTVIHLPAAELPPEDQE